MIFRAATTTCLIGLLLLLAPVTIADDSSWSRTFGATGDEALNHLEPLPDGGFVVAGATGAPGTGTPGLAALFDAAGDPLWLRTYDAGPLDEIHPTPDGGFIAAGHAGQLIYVVKLEDDGDIEWQQTHGFCSYFAHATVKPSADGGHFVGVAHGGDAAIVKLDLNGDFLWKSEIEDYGNSWPLQDLIPTPHGGVKLVRREGGDPWVQEFDAAGTLTQGWNFYGNPYGADIMAHVPEGESRATVDGGLISSGWAQTLSLDGTTTHDDAAIAKLGSDYSGEWFALVGRESTFETCRSVIERTDGGYVAALGQSSSSPPHHGCWIVRLDTEGQASWQWGSTGKCNVVRETDDGGLLLAGHRYVSGAGQDAWVAKLGPSGTLPSSCDFWTQSSLRTLTGYVTVNAASRPVLAMESEDAPVSATVAQSTMERAEQCSGEPVLGPDDEVSPRSSAVPLVFSDKVTLEWEDPAGGGVESFNLYQGWVGDLPGSYGDCLEHDLPSPTVQHTDDPPLGSTWFYLVTANTSFGETILGRDGFGRPRPNTSPCS